MNNVTLFYLYSFLRNLVPIYPVYMLLFQSQGLTLSQVSLLLAIWSLPVVLLELPTGILSDHWNRKHMVVIGEALHALCYVVWFLSSGFALDAVGFVLWGIGGACRSGSLEALLYDSLKRNGQEADFDRVYGRGNFYNNLSTALSMLSGGFLSSLLGMKAVLIISVATCLLATFIASRFEEINDFVRTTGAKAYAALNQSFYTLKDAVGLLWNAKPILVILLLGLLGINLSGMIDEYDQLIASGFGLGLGMVGAWGALRYLLEAVGGRYAYIIKRIFKKSGFNGSFISIISLCLVSGVFLGIAGLTRSIWLMPLYGLFFSLIASAKVIQEDFLQQNIQDQGRSTVHSILSLAENLCGIVLSLFFSAVLTGTGVFDILLISSVYLAAVCLVFGTIYAKMHKNESRNDSCKNMTKISDEVRESPGTN